MKLLNPWKYIIFILLLLGIDCLIGGFIGVWREWYWASISNKELMKWLLYVGEFSLVALLDCWIVGYTQYLQNILTLYYRYQLTRKAWKLDLHKVEGFNQRLQDDCLEYPDLGLSLISGLIRSIVMIIVFAIIIIKVLPVAYLFIPLCYTIIGTLIAGKIALPLINLNYVNQVIEAKFRQTLQKITYKDVNRNNFNLYKYTKYLNYFQSFYNQITIIFPHLVLAGLYFSGRLVFGVFMQIAASMTEITNNLSFIINSLNQINRLISCRKRLKEIGVL